MDNYLELQAWWIRVISEVQTRRIQVIPKYKRDTSCVDELNLKVPTEWAGVISMDVTGLNTKHKLSGLELL